MATQQPSYQPFTVVKREGQDDFWLNIGGAFLHQDGDGFNVQVLPINGKIVVRLPKSDNKDGATTEQAPTSNPSGKRPAQGSARTITGLCTSQLCASYAANSAPHTCGAFSCLSETSRI